MKRIKRESYEQLYTDILENLDEMVKFLDRHKPKLTHEKIENLNRSIKSEEIELY